RLLAHAREAAVRPGRPPGRLADRDRPLLEAVAEGSRRLHVPRPALPGSLTAAASAPGQAQAPSAAAKPCGPSQARADASGRRRQPVPGRVGQGAVLVSRPSALRDSRLAGYFPTVRLTRKPFLRFLE